MYKCSLCREDAQVTQERARAKKPERGRKRQEENGMEVQTYRKSRTIGTRQRNREAIESKRD